MIRTERPTLILLGGVILSSLIFGAGKANHYRLESKLHDLQATCVEEGKRNTLTTSSGGVYRCDAIDLFLEEKEDEPYKGIQAEILKTQRQKVEAESWSVPAAEITLFLSAFPWVWYFLLRRIKELREAIVGK